MAVLVIAGVMALGLLVGSVAEREDPLHEAELRGAELSTHVETVKDYSTYVVVRGEASNQDLLGSRVIAANAVSAATELEEASDSEFAQRIGPRTRELAFLGSSAVRLVYGERLAATRQRLPAIAASAARLDRDIGEARGRLAREIDSMQAGASTAVLLVSGAAGTLLVALMLAVTAFRRRRATQEAEQAVLRFRHRDGGLRTCEARAPSLLGDRDWDGVVLNIWDVSERKALEERLRHQAFHDGLTGLANRALFGDRLGHVLARAARRDDAGSVTVLLVDLDGFEAINDSVGHLAGDRLLRTVAERLDTELRAADTVARLGGDEFGVILDDSASEAADEGTARRLLAAIERPIEVGGRCFPIGASVGIARQGGQRATAEQLIRNADLAMYAAKANGRNDPTTSASTAPTCTSPPRTLD